MSSIRWDPRTRGHMLTNDTFKNFLLYMQENPLSPNGRANYRNAIWLWDYTTSTRTHLPPLFHQIYRATFHNNFIYVMTKAKKTMCFYCLDLGLKNKEWVKIKSLTMKFKDWSFLMIPYVMDSKNQDLMIIYDTGIKLYNTESDTSRTFPYRFADFDCFDIDASIHVGEFFYIIRKERLLVYDTKEEVVENVYQFHTLNGSVYSSHNCSGACVHVYDQRFIFIVLENLVVENQKPIQYWFIAVFDCKCNVWLHERRHRYTFNDFEDAVYYDGYRNYLWHENSLCFLHCRRTEDDNVHLDPHLRDADTIQYHISFFLPNWYVIKVYLLMRYLYEKDRATVREAYRETVQGMLFDLISEKGIHRLVLEYLVCKDKSRYCTVAN